MRCRTGIRGATVLAATLAVTGLVAQPGWAAGTDPPVGVTVQADRPLATIGAGAIGVNTPIWNPVFTDQATPALIRRAGIDQLEFNGGGVSDLYHFRDGSLSHDPDAASHPYDYFSLKPQFSFDQFEQTARAVGARSLVHVNYGTGTPEEAADWVRYANKVKHYGVRDWAIGEEVWGNGTLVTAEGNRINFEPDGHQDKSPAGYATNVVAFARAMKAVDPTIRVGIEVTGVAGGVFQQWDEAALAVAGPVVDFVDFHRYPFGVPDTSDAGLLQAPRTIPADLTALRQLVDRNSGARGHHVDLVAGETNSATVQAPQQISAFNGLYLADNNLTLLEHGARSVAWWALHNGGYGATRGDLGLLSSGDCNDDNTVCPPPANTPYPPYYAQQIVGAIATAGGRLVPVSSGDALVVGHAIRQPDGTLAILLLNEDPRNAQRIRLDLRGYPARHGLTVLSYAPGDTGVTTRHESGGGGARTLPPYSLTALLLHPGR